MRRDRWTMIQIKKRREREKEGRRKGAPQISRLKRTRERQKKKQQNRRNPYHGSTDEILHEDPALAGSDFLGSLLLGYGRHFSLVTKYERAIRCEPCAPSHGAAKRVSIFFQIFFVCKLRVFKLSSKKGQNLGIRTGDPGIDKDSYIFQVLQVAPPGRRIHTAAKIIFCVYLSVSTQIGGTHPGLFAA